MIARADGQVVLVSGAIPGEQVRARVDRVGKGVAFADTIAVDEPSADRRDAFIDLACGGCLLGHIAYARQLDIKSQVIADAFARIAHLSLPSRVAVVASPEEGYRMRARVHVRAHRVGFFREGTHDVCDVRQTRQLLPATCDTLDRLQAAIRSLGVRELREVEVSENVDATERVISVDAALPIDERVLQRLTTVEGLTPPPYVADVLAIGESKLKLRRHVRAFFQGNRFLLAQLVSHVADLVPAGTALLDLYAGAGLFSVAAAVVRGAWVIAVEGDRYAADDLHANGAASGAQITTVRGAVEGVGASYASNAARSTGVRTIDTIIVDPPRTGMSREALDSMLRVRAQRVIYVSCNVATLARDTRRIVDAGYTIERVDAFDMFPNTPHVETVVVFERATLA